MMHDMDYMGPSMGLSGFLFCLHVLAVLCFAIGVVFLVVWALRTLKPAQLRKSGIALAVVGGIVCCLTAGFCMLAGKPDMKMRMMKMDHNMNGGMMMNMDHEMQMGDDMMGMSMDDMTVMLEGKTGDEFDAAFIDMMIPHHQGAIDMAIAARESAGHEEIRAMADEIITAQQAEIDMMQAWQREWGYTE